eukprot:768812-Hanusia_phi.AAC.4
MRILFAQAAGREVSLIGFVGEEEELLLKSLVGQLHVGRDSQRGEACRLTRPRRLPLHPRVDVSEAIAEEAGGEQVRGHLRLQVDHVVLHVHRELAEVSLEELLPRRPRQVLAVVPARDDREVTVLVRQDEARPVRVPLSLEDVSSASVEVDGAEPRQQLVGAPDPDGPVARPRHDEIAGGAAGDVLHPIHVAVPADGARDLGVEQVDPDHSVRAPDSHPAAPSLDRRAEDLGDFALVGRMRVGEELGVRGQEDAGGEGGAVGGDLPLPQGPVVTPRVERLRQVCVHRPREADVCDHLLVPGQDEGRDAVVQPPDPDVQVVAS